MEAETGVMWPRAQAHLASPGAGRGRKASPSPHGCWRGFAPATPHSGRLTPGLGQKKPLSFQTLTLGSPVTITSGAEHAW